MAAEAYVSSCELLEGTTLRDATVVIPEGSLDLERLAAAGDAPPGHSQFLRFVPKPLGSIELARWRNRPGRPIFSAPGRLARVGLLARLVDAGLVASLLLRGRVPGGTTAAASLRFEAIRGRDPRVVYHGRVVREGRWVVLHYMFLYAMNDWRSTFEGANDHEADWEQCFVVCEALDDGEIRPAWFCAAAHDEKGDDLRRRWDDPRLQVIDGHPLVFPGAGSHATYLEQGEYIMRLPFPGERNIHGPLDLLRRIWRDTLDQPDPGDLAENAKRALSVPFVDYARGDGIAIGPGGDIAWTPIVIGDEDGWVDRYKGLWGLDTGDRFAGERAPAGPKYTRIGTVRQSWHDPLGFAGLDKVAPPSQAVAALEARIAELRRRARRLCSAEAAELERSLPLREAELGAIREAAGADAYRAVRVVELRESESRLAGAPQPGRPADDCHRCRPATGGRPAGRCPRRPARPPAPRVRARGSGRDEPAGAGRDVGRGQRRSAGRRPRGHPLVPDPAAGPRDRRPARVLPRDRVVLPPRCADPAAPHLDRAGDRQCRDPGLPVPARGAPRRAARARGAPHRRTTWGRCAAAAV